MTGFLWSKKESARVKIVTKVAILLLLMNKSATAFPTALGHNTAVANEPEYMGVSSPLAVQDATSTNAAVVAKTLAEMNNWKRQLLEEASRYRGLPGVAAGAGALSMESRGNMASPLLAVPNLEQPQSLQPLRGENERQAFCAYVSSDYTEQMSAMLQRLEVSCHGNMNTGSKRANECEAARNASRQFVNVIQLIQHSVCPDLGLF